MRRPKRQISLKECYAILRLQKGADLGALKRAYRRRAFELHPDLNPGDPDAGRQFQLLNEAYVALSAVLPPPKEEDGGDVNGGEREGDSKAEDRGGPGAAKPEDSKAPEGAGDGQAGEAKDAPDGEAPEPDGQQGEDGQRQGRQEATGAYAEEEVLRNLLNDPFARRVFEDIYSEVGKKQAAGGTREGSQPSPDGMAEGSPGTASGRTAELGAEDARRNHEGRIGRETRLHQTNIAWGTSKLDAEMRRGMTGIVWKWLRRQIDEEQTLTMPGDAVLVPGKRVRLQIRQGLSGAVRTVEVTLPEDFVPGKPVRLRGLGRRIGPWQGDLYLTISSESGTAPQR